jgi:hypothetical protein
MNNTFKGEPPYTPDLTHAEVVQSLVAMMIVMHGGLCEIGKPSGASAAALRRIASGVLRAVDDIANAGPQALKRYTRPPFGGNGGGGFGGALPIGSVFIDNLLPPAKAGAALTMTAGMGGGR